MNRLELLHASFPPLLHFPFLRGDPQVTHGGSLFTASYVPWKMVQSEGGLVAFSPTEREASAFGFLPVHLPDGSLPAYLRIAGRTSGPLDVTFVRQRLAHPEGGIGDSLKVRPLASRTIAPDDGSDWVIEVAPRWIPRAERTPSRGWQSESVIDNARNWYGISLIVLNDPDADSSGSTEVSGLSIAYYAGFSSP
jgi:hypothetical protein